jgi:hypothetical protein
MVEQWVQDNEVAISHGLKNEITEEFIEGLNQQQFAKIEDFFANLPKLEKKIEMKCSRCGFEHKLDVEGLESFFG